jgi:hypothetical protein
VLDSGYLTYYVDQLDEPPYGKDRKGQICLAGYRIVHSGTKGENTECRALLCGTHWCLLLNGVYLTVGIEAACCIYAFCRHELPFITTISLVQARARWATRPRRSTSTASS